jgi:hypothetical protein
MPIEIAKKLLIGRCAAKLDGERSPVRFSPLTARRFANCCGPVIRVRFGHWLGGDVHKPG